MFSEMIRLQNLIMSLICFSKAKRVEFHVNTDQLDRGATQISVLDQLWKAGGGPMTDSRTGNLFYLCPIDLKALLNSKVTSCHVDSYW